MPQKPLIQAPPKASGQLRPGEKNRPLGKDYLADAIDLILGGIGVNDALDPEDVSTATSLGALSTAGLGGAGMALLRRLRGVGRAATTAKPALTLDDAARFAANREKVLGKTPDVPFIKAELPAQFQGTLEEREAYNALRRNRENMRKLPEDQRTQFRIDSKPFVDPIRAAREKNAAAGLPSKLAPPKEDLDAILSDLTVEQRGTSLDNLPLSMLDNERAAIRSADSVGNPPYISRLFRNADPEPTNFDQLTFGKVGNYDSHEEAILRKRGEDFMEAMNRLQLQDTAKTDVINNVFRKFSERVNSNKRPNPSPLSYARQQEMSFGDFPLVSYDPNTVSLDQAQKASKQLNKTHDLLRSIEVPGQVPNDVSDLVQRVHLTGGSGGSYNLGTKKLVTGLNEAAGGAPNTIAHEMRHAVDKAIRPDVFKNYPDLSFSAFGIPAGYWSHPSEIRARATGGLGQLLDSSQAQGQLTLPLDFLEQFGQKQQTLFGNIAEDLEDLSRRSKPSYNFNPDPTQLKFDFNF